MTGPEPFNAALSSHVRARDDDVRRKQKPARSQRKEGVATESVCVSSAVGEV